MAKEFFLTKWIKGWRLDKAFDHIKTWAEDVVPKVIEVINNIKEWDAANPQYVDFLTNVIPGTWDNDLIAKIRASLIKNLPRVIEYSDCLNETDVNKMLVCLTTKLQSIPDLDVRALKIANLAALVAKDLENDGKLDINELAVIIKSFYEEGN